MEGREEEIARLIAKGQREYEEYERKNVDKEALEVSERSERALGKTRVRATAKLTYVILNSLARRSSWPASGGSSSSAGTRVSPRSSSSSRTWRGAGRRARELSI